MTCPKCKSENQSGNFCSNCANPLKEKCPECGEMEWIGGIVCKTKLQETYEKQRKYVENNASCRPDGEKGDKILILTILGHAGVMFSLYLAFLFQYLDQQKASMAIEIVLCSLVFSSCMTIIVSSKKYRKQWNAWLKEQENLYDKFLSAYPKYAEILKKAKSAEAEKGRGK